MIKLNCALLLGGGRCDKYGFDPDICNYRVEKDGVEYMCMNDLIVEVEEFCGIYERLFGVELKYVIRITKSQAGERCINVDFED